MFETRILTVRVQRWSQRDVVGAQLVSGDQEGRAIEWRLPLPVRPNGLTAVFFEAVEITTENAVGQRLHVSFDRLAGKTEPGSFAVIQKKESSYATTE